MEKKLLVATKNKGKMAEFSRMLTPFGFVVESMTEAGHDLDIVEDGTTFEQNAIIKSRTLWEASGCFTLADDSGLSIDALDGAPGVLSARYMGEETIYEVKMRGLLSALATTPWEQRTARFTSAIAFTTDKGETFTFLGSCEGYIGYEPKGTHGFGYDPIFMVGDSSYGELEDWEKDEISHRGKALEQFTGFLTNNLDLI